jgi:hypothetical protein
MPHHSFDTEQAKKIVAALPNQVSAEIEADLMSKVSRAVGLCQFIREKRELLRWTKARAAPLRRAAKAAGQLVEGLNDVDIGIRRWFRYPTFATTDFEGLLRSSQEIHDLLLKCVPNLPQYTPPRQTNFHFLILIEKSTWCLGEGGRTGC